MLFFLLLLLIALIFWKSRFSSFHHDYIDKEGTSCIKGVFAIMILLSHMRGYLDPVSSTERIADVIISSWGQLIVAMFFFYSGFGILESYKSKPHYKDSFFTKRICKTLLHFDLAVALFLIVESIIGNKYPAINYIFCWIGWESIGNSNWFVFDILALYSITLIVMKIVDRVGGNRLLFVNYLSILVSLLWVCLVLCRRGSWWYDTILCYPTGMFYSLHKNGIEKAIKNKSLIWFYTSSSLLVLFCLCHLIHNSITISLEAIVFTLLLTFITMRIRINNRVLYWLGIYAFPIYILQRLPMNVLSKCQLHDNNLFIIITIPSVLLLSWLFKKTTDSIDAKLFIK